MHGLLAGTLSVNRPTAGGRRSSGLEIAITGAEGQIFIYSAGTKGVLAVIAPKGGNAGLVHLEARAVAKDVGDLLEKRSPAAGSTGPG